MKEEDLVAERGDFERAKVLAGFNARSEPGFDVVLASLHTEARRLSDSSISRETQQRLEDQLAALGKARSAAEREQAGREFESAAAAIVAEIRSGGASAEKELEGALDRIRAGVARLVEEAKTRESGIRPLVEELRTRIEAGEIPLFPEDQRGLAWEERLDPIEFLGHYYGEHLRHFGAAENRLFQSDLGQLDPGLLTKVRNRVNYRRRKEGWMVSVEEIVPPLSAEAGETSPLSEAERRMAAARMYAASQRHKQTK